MSPIACNCGKNKIQYEVVDAGGARTFGPTPFKTTADAMAVKHKGTVREIKKDGA